MKGCRKRSKTGRRLPCSKSKRTMMTTVTCSNPQGNNKGKLLTYSQPLKLKIISQLSWKTMTKKMTYLCPKPNKKPPLLRSLLSSSSNHLQSKLKSKTLPQSHNKKLSYGKTMKKRRKILLTSHLLNKTTPLLRYNNRNLL